MASRFQNATIDAPCFVPPLLEVAHVLQAGLARNFERATVDVVECPDLTCGPYSLAASGLGGSPKLVDVGGVPYLVPLIDRSRVYNMKDVAAEIALPGAFFIGAGAGSSRLAGINCELMPNTHLATANIQTYFAKVGKAGEMVLEHYESNEFGPLCNMLASQGQRGPVLHVRAGTRTGDSNFVTCMRQALAARYGTQPVGVGGVFVIKAGHAKLHVMPDFSATPLLTDADVEHWLKFYQGAPPLTCLSTFISHDPGLDLRVEHTHCFSAHGEGGHYHHDTTPANVEYEGYFTLAEHVYHIDPPSASHKVGRD